jgi:hypothetical protein
MNYRGRVRNGQVVLDPPNRLPEGAEVVVEVLESSVTKSTMTSESPLMRHAGQAKGLAEDASESIDRVLYGRDES